MESVQWVEYLRQSQCAHLFSLFSDFPGYSNGPQKALQQRLGGDCEDQQQPDP
jgi:hypothetical protein